MTKICLTPEPRQPRWHPQGRPSWRSAADGGCRGATTVEAAVVLPLVFAFIFGIFSFGRSVSLKAAVDQALRLAAGYAATLEGDCLTPARDRFFDRMAGLGFGSEILFRGSVIRLDNGIQALQITALADRDDLLPFGSAVRSFVVVPVEMPDGCSGRASLVASSARTR